MRNHRRRRDQDSPWKEMIRLNISSDCWSGLWYCLKCWRSATSSFWKR